MNSVFNYNQNQVRTTLINNKPYFCLVDCCKVLHIRNSKTTAQLNKDGVGKTYLTDNLGRKQEATFINEPNLYRLIFRSNKPEAQKFANWVYEEVLPQIRKTGEYKPDFETTLTTVKQHTRKLPTQRVKKEIVLSETSYEELVKRIEERLIARKVLSTLGGVVNRCMDSRIDRIEKLLTQPKFNFNQMDLPEAQKVNMKVFSDMNKSIADYGKICEIVGQMQGIVALKKILPVSLYSQVSKCVNEYAVNAK